MKFHRPLLLLVLAALLPLVVLSAALGVAGLRQRQTELQQQAQSKADTLATLLVQELEGHIGVAKAITTSPAFDGELDQERVRIVMERLVRDHPTWRTAILSNAAGDRLFAVPDLFPGQKTVTDVESNRRAVETRVPVIKTMMRPGYPPVFGIRAPVVRNGRALYVVTAIVDPAALQSTLKSANLPPEWISGVLDEDGRLIARYTAGEDSSRFIGKIARPEAIEAVRRAPSGIYEAVSLSGKPVFTAYRVLPGSRWSVHVGAPRALYAGPLRRSVWLLAGGGAISLAMAGVFVWLMLRELELRRREEAMLESGRRMEALGRMTGGVAHDFNNLLMIIQGSAELAKRRSGDPQRVADYADAILTAARRGQSLIRQLLAFARRGAHEPVGFALQSRKDELATLLSRSGRGDIETEIVFPDDLWPVFADPNALEIALINLAVNARDAMPYGGRLTVQGRNLTLSGARSGPPLEGDFVALSVADTGQGISAADLPHIFEPFFTTKTADKGTGLGLSQVYGFARQAGGTVTVESVLGQGATFTLYLPRSRDGGREPAEAIPHAEGRQDGRVLLVEDNASVADVTEGMLRQAGYDVVWASSGREALGRVDAGEAFDVVLSDIVMDSGLSGLELAPLIQARRPNLPVVLMTGYSEALAKGGQVGLPVLSKPFQQAEVVAALAAARRRVPV